jgi:SAM-dependent methyltransferase
MEKDLYNFIAADFNKKKSKPWKDLETFVKEIKEKKISFTGYNIDLGCGNGRNFSVFKQPNTKLIGVDNSFEFLKIARDRLKSNNNPPKNSSNFIQLILSDILFLPIRPNIIQNIFSIATIHHIKDKAQLNNAISKFNRLLRNKGYFLFTVWRKYQKNYRSYFIKDKIKRLFNPKYRKVQFNLGLNEYGDKFVPWTLSAEKKTYNRFYHFFSNKEIKKLLNEYTILELKKMGGPNKKDNFFILAQKLIK